MSRADWSRRRFAGALAGAAAAVTLAACDGESSPADAPVPKAPATATGPPASEPPTGPRPLYLGTYTSAEGGGEGIGPAGYDPETGRITATGTLTGVPDPSYPAVHPDGRTLYAVNEREDGAVTAVRLSDRKILGSRSTGGASPCPLSVHPGGRYLLSADYGSGTVAVHRIGASGPLGERTALVAHSAPPPGPGQQGPHAHQFLTGPDGGHVLAVDLGTDTVHTYRLDETSGGLAEVSRPVPGPVPARAISPSTPAGGTPIWPTNATTRSRCAPTIPARDACASARRSPRARGPPPATRHSSWSPGTAASPFSPTGVTTA